MRKEEGEVGLWWGIREGQGGGMKGGSQRQAGNSPKIRQ